MAVSSSTSLWLGQDHLLFVESNGYTETYKRFYFRDIQALMVERTQTFKIVNIVLTIPVGICLALGLATQSTGLKIFLFCVAGFLALILSINLWRGQTCRSFLRTAVQIEQLPPLSRVRRAQKVFNRIRPLIAGAQGGELTADMITNLIREQVRTSAPQSQGDPQTPGIPPRLDS